MITPIFRYLQHILETRPIEFPQPVTATFKNGFKAEHLKCHLTAAQVAVEFGYEPVMGIQMLDLAGKLFPWPHIVNKQPHGLTDYSPTPDQPKLGFIVTGWSELAEWRETTGTYNAFTASGNALKWGHPEADELSDIFYEKLKGACA